MEINRIEISKKLKMLLRFAILVSMLNSCNTTELEILDNPSALLPEQASEDEFISSIQLKLAEFFDSGNTDNFLGINELGMKMTRMTAMTLGNSYQNAVRPADMDGVYEDAFVNAMIDIRSLYPLAEEKELFTHLAIAQIAESYIMMTMVDYFGDVPYFEAFQGAENLAPNLSLGSEIYGAIENLLDEAIVNLNKEQSADVDVDFFYGGDELKWINLANTLKLKLYVQTKLVDDGIANKIDVIVNSGNYIQNAEDDFQFNYSTVDINPDSRHPLFGPNFDNGKINYMGNSYMNLIVNQETAEGENLDDPRRRYYFYRQDLNFDAADNQTLPCTLASKPLHYSSEDPFCQVVSPFGSGYWGRDHGDDDGIPPDDSNVVLFGVYPVGGPFDDNSGNTISNRENGLEGAGSSMIMLSSYVQFMLAETSLMNGVTGDSRTYLEQGIRQSINKVMSFGNPLINLSDISIEDDPDTVVNEEETVEEVFNLTNDDVNNYVEEILNKYDLASSNDLKLDIIIEQYFIALFNNGVEAYNTYRRTGKPDLQPTLLAAPGVFMRTFPYPGALVNRNNNVNSKPISTQVFWDVNPANFID